MQAKPDVIRLKSKTILCLAVLMLLLGFATPALADYLGPNRTATESHVETYEYGVWAKDDPGYPNNPTCNHHGGSDCIVCTWSHSPGNPCGDAEYWYTLGSKSEVVTTSVNLDPATINSSLQNCKLNNGWCVTAPQLFLSANEPLTGYNILAIEGSRNGQTFACVSSSCSIPLTEGNNSFIFWALSSYGDSSAMGIFSAKVDTVSPSAGLDISGSNGTNSWFVSPTTVTATGSDSTSGLLSTLLSVNDGPWLSSTTLNEGVHHINVRAEDNAGNVSNSSATILVDTTTPTLDVSVSGTIGNNGWYISDVKVAVTANDATSGIGSLEVSSDDNAYQTYTVPVLFSDGHHTIRFKATDKAGNVTETPTQEFHVDTIAPGVDIPKSWEAGKTVTYGVQDPGSGLSALRVVIEDEDEKYAKVFWDEVVSGSNFEGEVAWNGKFADKKIAPPGEYLVWIKASDKAGNEYFGLGKIIVPGPNMVSSLFKTDTAFKGIPVPPKELTTSTDTLNVSVAATSTSHNSNFGGSTNSSKEITNQSLILASGAAAASTTASSDVLWGAAATVVIGAATAYVLDERRKRKEEEARQLAEAEAEAAKLNAAEEERKANAWLEGQAILKAQRDAVILQAQNARMETKMARVEAEEEARWMASQTAIQKRASEKDERARSAESARWAGLASQGQHAANMPASASNKTSWWQKGMEWIDHHQAEIALGVGIAVGIGALILSGGTAAPLVAAAWIAGAAAVAGGTVALGTIGLNLYYGRDWKENVVRNLAISAITAGVITGAGFLLAGNTLLKLGNGVASYCTTRPDVCARADFALKAMDKLEEVGLMVQGAIQTARGDEIGAAQTFAELQAEHMDGGIPGNTAAVELAEQLAKLGDDATELIAKHGDEIIPLLAKYGDDAVGIIGAYGDDGIKLLLTHGDEAVSLINIYGTPAVEILKAIDPSAARNLLQTLDDDVLAYAIEQGPDAVSALSRWSEKELLDFGPELALRAKKDAKALEAIKNLVSSKPIDPKHLTPKQIDLIKTIAQNSMQYSDEGQIVLGKWVDYGNGFTSVARETGSVHYNPHPDMWNLLGELGDKREETAWLVNQQVIQIGIDKGLPFEYTLEGIPLDDLFKEQSAVQLIFSGASDLEITSTLRVKKLNIRWQELKELHKAGYELVFDEINNSFILSIP